MAPLLNLFWHKQPFVRNFIFIKNMDRVIKKKIWTTKKVALSAGGVLLAIFAGYSFIFADTRSKLNVETQKVTIAEVRQGSFQELIPVDGNVQPIKTIFLDAIEGGVVEKRFREGGTLIKAGDTILKLSNNNLMLDFVNRETLMYDLINNLQNTKLGLERNKFELRKQLSELNYQIDAARVTYENYERLYNEKMASKQEYLNAKREFERLIEQRKIAIESQRFDSINAVTQIAQLESTIRRTNRNLEMFKENLKNLYVKAPVAGQLSSINVEVGESISTGQRLGQIDDLNGFKVRAAIDQHYISRIYTDLKGQFDFGGKTYDLKITKIYPEVQDGRFQADLEFEGTAPAGIRRGQTLQIKLQLSDAVQATLVPRGGFFQSTGGNWIFVVDLSGEFATRRSIRLGRQNPGYYEVTEGLQPGEKVLVSSYESYGDIQKLVLKK
jgi:HlyD family secretion protein